MYTFLVKNECFRRRGLFYLKVIEAFTNDTLHVIPSSRDWRRQLEGKNDPPHRAQGPAWQPVNREEDSNS